MRDAARHGILRERQSGARGHSRRLGAGIFKEPRVPEGAGAHLGVGRGRRAAHRHRRAGARARARAARLRRGRPRARARVQRDARGPAPRRVAQPRLVGLGLVRHVQRLHVAHAAVRRRAGAARLALQLSHASARAFQLDAFLLQLRKKCKRR